MEMVYSENLKIILRPIKFFLWSPKRWLFTSLEGTDYQSTDAHHFLKVGKKNHHGCR